MILLIEGKLTCLKINEKKNMVDACFRLMQEPENLWPVNSTLNYYTAHTTGGKFINLCTWLG